MNFDLVFEVKRIGSLIVFWCRDFYMYLEFGYEEERIFRIVEEYLCEWGYLIKCVGIGIIVDIGEGEKMIVFRVDMDVLFI